MKSDVNKHIGMRSRQRHGEHLNFKFVRFDLAKATDSGVKLGHLIWPGRRIRSKARSHKTIEFEIFAVQFSGEIDMCRRNKEVMF